MGLDDCIGAIMGGLAAASFVYVGLRLIGLPPLLPSASRIDERRDVLAESGYASHE